MKRRKLRTIDDLLTPAQREELTADLTRIRDAVRPGFIGPAQPPPSTRGDR